MTAPPIIPDVPTPTAPTILRVPAAANESVPNEFANIVNDLGSVLRGASQSEDNFAAGAGDLQTAIYERARADVVLAVATAAAQRTTAALQSILNMQV